MQQAIVSTLPFLGQIVKVITKDGIEYDVKISEELPDNDKVFSIMFRNNTNNKSNINKKQPPLRPELPLFLKQKNAESLNNEQEEINAQEEIIESQPKKNKNNKKINYTKGGSSINPNIITEQPFTLNF